MNRIDGKELTGLIRAGNQTMFQIMITFTIRTIKSRNIIKWIT